MDTKCQTFECEKSAHLGIFLNVWFMYHVIPKSKMWGSVTTFLDKTGQVQVKAKRKPVKGTARWLLLAIRSTWDKLITVVGKYWI